MFLADFLLPATAVLFRLLVVRRSLGVRLLDRRRPLRVPGVAAERPPDQPGGRPPPRLARPGPPAAPPDQPGGRPLPLVVKALLPSLALPPLLPHDFHRRRGHP
jgi:hypothetical protein